MKRLALVSAVAASLGLGPVGPVLAAEPLAVGTANHPATKESSVSAPKPAEKCLSDLRAFDSQMEKSGYWLGASGDSYGFPVDASGYGYGYFDDRHGDPMGDQPVGGHQAATTGYQYARRGYEVRTLPAGAGILAQNGQQQPCEDVLATTHNIYKLYVADLHGGGVHPADAPNWRKQQILAATPVTANNASFRSDELIGTDVRSPQDVALGGVDTLVMSPRTGKIAYLVIARGGLFGIDKKYVPVPWDDFKITPSANLLVLDATKDAMAAAPEVNNNQFAAANHFDQQSLKIDAYWKGHLTKNGNIPSKG
jgi:hypothetical protein